MIGIFLRGKPPELEFINDDRLPPTLENLKKAAESTDWPPSPTSQGQCPISVRAAASNLC
jgi:hypothetical protein